MEREPVGMCYKVGIDLTLTRKGLTMSISKKNINDTPCSTCGKPSVGVRVGKILRTQNTDGSFSNKPDGDPVYFCEEHKSKPPVEEQKPKLRTT